MNRSLVMLALAALLLVAVAFLVGCAKKPADSGPVVVQPPELGDLPDAPAPGDTAAKPKPTPKDPKSMADIIDSATLPDSFKATITMTDGSTVVQLVVTRDNKPYKMVMEAQGTKTYMDMEEGVMYDLPEGQDTATKMVMSDDLRSHATRNSDVFPDTTEVTGSETVNGVDCWVVEPKEARPGGVGGKTWLAKDTGLRHRMALSGREIKVAYDRIGEVSEAEVTLPDGIEVKEFDMPDMPATD